MRSRQSRLARGGPGTRLGAATPAPVPVAARTVARYSMMRFSRRPSETSGQGAPRQSERRLACSTPEDGPLVHFLASQGVALSVLQRVRHAALVDTKDVMVICSVSQHRQ